MKQQLIYLAVFLLGAAAELAAHEVTGSRKVDFKIGDCLSNGLYYEKVIDIRYSDMLNRANYVLSPTIGGKVHAPDVEAAWLVNDTYVKISGSNCK